MHSSGSKRSDSDHPTLIQVGSWQHARNFEQTRKVSHPHVNYGLIGCRGRRHLRRYQPIKWEIQNNLSVRLRYSKYRPFSTPEAISHGIQPRLLMVILSGRRWYDARRIGLRPDNSEHLSTLKRHHPRRRTAPYTWHLARQPSNFIISSNSSKDRPARATPQTTSQLGTINTASIYSPPLRQHRPLRYNNMGNCPVLLIILNICVKKGVVFISAFTQARLERIAMKEGISRCKAANEELQTARRNYETRTVTRIKRKMAEMEAEVKREEDVRSEKDIAAEVDWVTDPGTTAKRATQFVRTKAECWRMKTLIAKALESVTEVNLTTQVNLTTEQMARVTDFNSSLDSKLTAVNESIKTQNRLIMILIQLLKNSIDPAPVMQHVNSNANYTAQPSTSAAIRPTPMDEVQIWNGSHAGNRGLNTMAPMEDHRL